MDEAVKALEENHARIKAQKIEADPTVAKLSIVGAGMQTHPGVAAGMFEALYNIGVNIRMIGTSEIRVTVLVDEKDVDKAMRAAHDRFIETNSVPILFIMSAFADQNQAPSLTCVRLG